MSINRVSKINVKYTDGSEYVFNSITECSKSLNEIKDKTPSGVFFSISNMEVHWNTLASG